MTALSSAAAVAAENVRLRAEIARLRNLTLLPEIGPEPDFDTPVADLLTQPCASCGAGTTRELCDDCDDRADEIHDEEMAE